MCKYNLALVLVKQGLYAKAYAQATMSGGQVVLLKQKLFFNIRVMNINSEDRMSIWKYTLYSLGIIYKKRSSGTLVFLCPFHGERHPSCHIFESSSRFFCHGCHAEGTHREFVGLMEWKYEGTVASYEAAIEVIKEWRMSLDPNQLWLFPEFKNTYHQPWPLI